MSGTGSDFLGLAHHDSVAFCSILLIILKKAKEDPSIFYKVVRMSIDLFKSEFRRKIAKMVKKMACVWFAMKHQLNLDNIF